MKKRKEQEQESSGKFQHVLSSLCSALLRYFSFVKYPEGKLSHFVNVALPLSPSDEVQSKLLFQMLICSDVIVTS